LDQHDYHLDVEVWLVKEMDPIPSSSLEIPIRSVIIVGLYAWNVVPAFASAFALVALLNFLAAIVDVPLSWILVVTAT
jgi:hypothetical protein